MAKKKGKEFEREEVWRYLEITGEDLENVRRLQQVLLPEWKKVMEVMAEHSRGFADAGVAEVSGADVLLRPVDSEPPEAYLERRRRLGGEHCRRGVEISRLLGAYGRCVDVVLQGMSGAAGGLGSMAIPCLRSFMKLVFVDIVSVAEGYVAELRGRSEGHFRSIFEAASDAIFLFAPDGTILDANPAALELLGQRSKEELIGGRCYRVVHGREERCSARECTIERVLRGEQVRGMLHRHRSAGGGLIEVEVSASGVRDSGGRVVAVVEAARDVTSRERARRELESRIAELERWRRVTVDRELRMAELKEENRRLRREVERLRRICAEVGRDVEGDS
ncbi:MAG: PAS domain S-box protein [Euryarchaeota archaeon]|nr:PAS domain S-box protein [Euryarchaeota archaeon]